MMGYWSYGWSPGMHLFGGVLSLLIWVFFMVAVIAILRRGFRGGSGNGWGGWRDGGERDNKRALDILRERYARGEIGKEEYLEKKKDLENL